MARWSRLQAESAPADSQSRRLRGLSAGTITDWGLAGSGAKAKQAPISMAGGIPDAASQPKVEILNLHHAIELMG